MNKYNIILKKPSSDIVKYILGTLLLTGMVVIACTSPFFVQNLLRGFKKARKYPNKKVYDTFYKLKKDGVINFYYKNNQIHFLLTKKGQQKAGWMRVDDLKIKKLEKWDGKWRVLLFDIAELRRLYREAFRGKLISMGFVMLQKSVWIIPYECKREIEMLKSFFGLSEKEIRLLTVKNIGQDKEYKKFFRLN